MKMWKKFWKFLSGKKTNIAASIGPLVMWAIELEYLTGANKTLALTIASVWTFGALGHKTAKRAYRKRKKKKESQA